MTFVRFENARLRSRKINQALDDLGVEPTARLRPSYLLPPRKNELLLNRALATVGRMVDLTGNERVDASALNVAFALVSGDFTNFATNNPADGVYTLNGEPATLGDIIDLASSPGFDPEVNLGPDGMLSPDGNAFPMVLTEAVVDLIVGGFTGVFEVYADTTAMAANMTVKDGLNLNPKVFIETNPEYLGFTATGSDSNYVQPSYPTGQIGRVAFTIAVDHISVSLNGEAVIRWDVQGVFPQYSAGDLQFGGDTGSRFRSFAFYEIVDDADLPSLSAP